MMKLHFSPDWSPISESSGVLKHFCVLEADENSKQVKLVRHLVPQATERCLQEGQNQRLDRLLQLLLPK